MVVEGGNDMSDRFWLQDMIDAAEANGEEVPAGVYLVGNRKPTPAEVEYGLALVPLARRCLGLDTVQAGRSRLM